MIRTVPAGRSALDVVLRRPAAVVLVGFMAATGVGTAFLVLPVAAEGEGGAEGVTAVFTAVSALFGGLVVVDTPTYWSTFGEIAILVMMQAGGIGIMTLATLLALVVTRRMGLRMQLNAQEETRVVGLGDVRRVITGVVLVSLTTEALVAVPVTLRFAAFYEEPFGRALYLGVFHSVSAFNNAGFALFSANMVPFATDALICLPLAVGSIAGSIGFPVLSSCGGGCAGRPTGGRCTCA